MLWHTNCQLFIWMMVVAVLPYTIARQDMLSMSSPEAKTKTTTTPTSTTTTTTTIPTTSGKLLSRKRRYVAFPDGSSASVGGLGVMATVAALCMTIGVLGNPHASYLSWAINWGVAWNLPNYTWAIDHAHGFKSDIKETKPVVQRRTRRDLYEQVELAMDSMGFNGHACLARALCESAKYLRPSPEGRGNMIEEIVKTIFSLPASRVHDHEPSEVQIYDRIYRRARRDVRECSETYDQCHFSLLELALGKYTVEPTRYRGGMMPMHNFM